MKRAVLDTLPDQVRADLDAQIRAAGFYGFAALRAWLAERGHKVSVPTLWRYAQELKTTDAHQVEEAERRLIFDLAVNHWPHRPDSLLVNLAKEVKEARDWINSFSGRPTDKQDVQP